MWRCCEAASGGPGLDVLNVKVEEGRMCLPAEAGDCWTIGLTRSLMEGATEKGKEMPLDSSPGWESLSTEAR